MSKRIVFMGAGAVGGYIGGHIARLGEDVTRLDPWPEHIEYIKRHGIRLSGTQGEHTLCVKALHLHEVQSLYKTPVDIAFICIKSYDTEWATMMLKQSWPPTALWCRCRTASMRSASPISWAGASPLPEGEATVEGESNVRLCHQGRAGRHTGWCGAVGHWHSG